MALKHKIFDEFLDILFLLKRHFRKNFVKLIDQVKHALALDVLLELPVDLGLHVFEPKQRRLVDIVRVKHLLVLPVEQILIIKLHQNEFVGLLAVDHRLVLIRPENVFFNKFEHKLGEGALSLLAVAKEDLLLVQRQVDIVDLVFVPLREMDRDSLFEFNDRLVEEHVVEQILDFYLLQQLVDREFVDRVANLQFSELDGRFAFAQVSFILDVIGLFFIEFGVELVIYEDLHQIEHAEEENEHQVDYLGHDLRGGDFLFVVHGQEVLLEIFFIFCFYIYVEQNFPFFIFLDFVLQPVESFQSIEFF